MDITRMGKQGLTGWRKKVGEPVADTLARATGLSPDVARALLGAGFVAISLLYVAKVLVAAVQVARS